MHVTQSYLSGIGHEEVIEAWNVYYVLEKHISVIFQIFAHGGK